MTDFEIEFRWKEEVYYWEGVRGCRFEGGWGVRPAVTYVPSATRWADVAPDWAHDRRDQILERLVAARSFADHRVQETDDYASPIGVTRAHPEGAH